MASYDTNDTEHGGLVVSGSLLGASVPQATAGGHTSGAGAVSGCAAAYQCSAPPIGAALGVEADGLRGMSSCSGGLVSIGESGGGGHGHGALASASAGGTSAGGTWPTDPTLPHEHHHPSANFHPGCGFVDGRFVISADDPRGSDAWCGESTSFNSDSWKFDRAMCGVPSAVGYESKMAPHGESPLRAVEDWWAGVVDLAKSKMAQIDLSSKMAQIDLSCGGGSREAMTAMTMTTAWFTGRASK